MSKENVTMSDIAKELGVSRAYISMIASGKRKPNKDFVNKLENLGVTTKLNVNKLDTNSLTLNQQVTGSIPVRLTTENTHSVNDFVNNLLAMIYEQNKDPQTTELLIGGVQLGTPKVKQQWVDDFLASRPQNTSINTFRY